MDKKIIIILSVATFLIIGGGVLFVNSLPSNTSKTLGVSIGKTPGVKIEIRENNFDFKNVSYSGGNVERSFSIKNIGDKDLKVANLSTSCMCTTVYLKTAQEKGPEFGMEGHSKSVEWMGTLKSQEEGQLVVVFDPTAHGPSGVGPFSRFISFETNDPDKPYIELAINGIVVKD